MHVEAGSLGGDGHLISDDILAEFAVIGAPSTIAGQIKSRYGDLIDRTSAAYANDCEGRPAEDHSGTDRD